MSIAQKAKLWKELVGGAPRFSALGVSGLGLGHQHQNKGRGRASTPSSPLGLPRAWGRGCIRSGHAPPTVCPILSTGGGQAEQVHWIL